MRSAASVDGKSRDAGIVPLPRMRCTFCSTKVQLNVPSGPGISSPCGADMLIDAAADIAFDLRHIESIAASAESDGYDGLGIPEARHDVFTALALAARATTQITLQSTIAVAF